MKNSRRIALARQALKITKEEYGDEQTALVDLLANLMHWATNQEVDFQDALESANHHYQAEKEPQP